VQAQKNAEDFSVKLPSMIWFEVSIGRGAEALVIPGLFVFQVIRIEGFIKGQKSRKLLEKLCAIVTHQQTRQATKTYI